MLGGRDIHGWVGSEKADGFQRKSRIGDGHDRPVFGAGNVMVAKGIPDDDIGIFDRAIALGPLG